MSSRAELPYDEWIERLALEYNLMQQHEPTFDIVNGDIKRHQGVIIGSDLYDEGFFRVEISVDRNFPFTPPKVQWLTKIWHPNITENVPASVCESVLSRDWSPALHIFSVVETLRALLGYPNPRDPLNRIAGDQMISKPFEFEKTAREYLMRYATAEQAFR